MKPIDFWYFIGSTYSYLTVMRLAEVADATGAAFRWRPFNVRDIMVEQNNRPFVGKPVKSAYMWRDIERRAALYGLPFARDIYRKADPKISGRVTVPILWDKKRETIVSNESSEIIRMFDSAFDGLTGNTLSFWPEELRAAIDARRDRLAPETLEILDKNLAIIDGAIEELQSVLEADPGGRPDSDELRAMHAEKLQLLLRFNELVS